MRQNKVNRLFNVFDKRYGTGFAGNVWDSNGVAPTLTTMGGGNREPMIRIIHETE